MMEGKNRKVYILISSSNKIKMFERIPEFYEDAKENEEVFRAILRDLNKRKDEFSYIPHDFNPELPLEELLATYAPEPPFLRRGRFTIIDFRRGPYDPGRPLNQLTENEALVGFQDVALLSGGGYLLKYIVHQDNSVNYKEEIISWGS